MDAPTHRGKLIRASFLRDAGMGFAVRNGVFGQLSFGKRTSLFGRLFVAEFDRFVATF